MASIITATTTSGLTQSADNSGVLQLASGVGNLVTVPSVTGTAMVSGNMPAFMAFLNSVQTPSAGVLTKIQFNVEVFDTANCYDNSTNYRFTPNVAGYYQFTMGMSPSASVTGIGTRFYKNGSIYVLGNDMASNANCIQSSALIYMNGTTDYVEGYAYVSTGGFFGNASQFFTYFQGVLVRSA